VTARAHRVIDFHTHAFPDDLAPRAMGRLETEGKITASLDGTVGALLASMDRAKIEVSVVASVATRPEQFDAILRWSRGITSPRIVPFPSVHPADPLAASRLRAIAAAGFRGVKLHPYYQGFVLDDEGMMPIYDEIRRLQLTLLCHTGFDFAYERTRIADPPRLARVMERFPDLRLVATHLGAWDDWDEVERLLVGTGVTMDVAFVFGFLDASRVRRVLLRHPADRLLFGTDSPWADQATVLESVLSLDLPPQRLDALLWTNAAGLLAPQAAS